MTRRSTRVSVLAALMAAAVTAVGLAAPAARTRVFVTPPASALVEQGLAGAAPAEAEARAFEVVPGPGVRFVENVAQATTAPWVDSNAWRFQRGVRKVHYAKLAPGASPLAAAESFVFD